MFVMTKTQNNGLFLFKTTLLVHINCKEVPLATDGQDGKGLQLEKNRADVFKFSCCQAKTVIHLLNFILLSRIHFVSSWSSQKTIL